MNRLEPPVRISGVCSCCKKFTNVFLPRGILAKKFDQLCGPCYRIIARERADRQGPTPRELGMNPRALGTNPRAAAGRPFLYLYKCQRCRAELGSPLEYRACYLCGGPITSRRIYS